MKKHAIAAAVQTMFGSVLIQPRRDIQWAVYVRAYGPTSYLHMILE
jgi:hypothetical protein